MSVAGVEEENTAIRRLVSDTPCQMKKWTFLYTVYLTKNPFFHMWAK